MYLNASLIRIIVVESVNFCAIKILHADPQGIPKKLHHIFFKEIIYRHSDVQANLEMLY